MLAAIVWGSVVLLLLFWSLAAWALHGLAGWALSSAGGLSGAAGNLGTLGLPAWLADWLPSEIQMWILALKQPLAEAIQTLLQWMPALDGALGFATWLVWGLGSLLLVLTGAAVHLLVALGRGWFAGARPAH